MVARSVFPRLFVSQNIHGSGLRKSPGLFGPRFRSIARVSCMYRRREDGAREEGGCNLVSFHCSLECTMVNREESLLASVPSAISPSTWNIVVGRVA